MTDASCSSFLRDGTICLAKCGLKQNLLWPAIILPQADIPEYASKVKVTGRICVELLGPPIVASRKRDAYWVKPSDIFDYDEHIQSIMDGMPAIYYNDEKTKARKGALEEAFTFCRPPISRSYEKFRELERSQDVSVVGASSSGPKVCSSCGIQLVPQEIGLAEDYQGRCISCIAYFEGGGFCQLCNAPMRSREPSVACTRCPAVVHTQCDRRIASAQTLEDYVCPSCEAKLQESYALLMQYIETLRRIKPCPPRNDYNIFVDERFREYRAGYEGTERDLVRYIAEQWDSLTKIERTPFERQAALEAVSHAAKCADYWGVYEEYTLMAKELNIQVDESLAPEGLHPSGTRVIAPGKLRGRGGKDRPRFLGPGGGHLPCGKGTKKKQGALALKASSGPLRIKRERQVGMDGEEYTYRGETAAGTRDESGETAGVKRPRAGSATALPPELLVTCNGMRGVFVLATGRVRCGCQFCDGSEHTPPQWEQHCGAGSAKKWKASIKIEPGFVPEVPAEANPLQIGKYFDLKGVDLRPSRTTGLLTVVPLADGPSGPSSLSRLDLPAKRPAEHALERGSELTGDRRDGRLKTTPRAGDGKGAREGPPPPWMEMTVGSYTPIHVKWAGDRCCICDLEVDYEDDQLVSCSQCWLTMHQSCYGILEVNEDDMWLCRSCELSDPNKPAPRCCLCPVVGGAMKPSTLPDLWVHEVCANWIPPLTHVDPERHEPVDGIPDIEKGRWELGCVVCKQRVGAKVQCCMCCNAFHTLCGRLAGYRMDTIYLEDDTIDRKVYCYKHCTPMPALSGVQRIKVGDQSEETWGDNGEGLWNGQPYPPPIAAPLPTPSTGCARSEPLKLERAFHGTGVGWTSTSGFWIPSVAEPLPLSGTAAGDTGVKLERRGRGRGPRPFGGPRPAAAPDSGPPPKVNLVPLPAGVPESVGVVCAGRRAQLFIRSQRVIYGGQEMSASRFEQLCGKGDAKKWKASLWLDDGNGHSVRQMQDWLASMRLDRSALAGLASNAAAYEAYEAWEKGSSAAAEDEGDEHEGDPAGETRSEEVGEDVGMDSKGTTPATEQEREEDRTEEPRAEEGAGSEAGVKVEEMAKNLDDSKAAVKTTKPTVRLRPIPPNDLEDILPSVTLDRALPTGSAGATPALCVGHSLRVYWPIDCQWYEAEVVGYSKEMHRHRLWYFQDDEEEEVDLVAEETEGRVQWLPPSGTANWPPPLPPPTEPGVDPSGPSPGESSPVPEDVVGRRVGVWWSADRVYYYGTVVGGQPEREGYLLVHYDDNEYEWLEVGRRALQWDVPEEEMKADEDDEDMGVVKKEEDMEPGSPGPEVYHADTMVMAGRSYLQVSSSGAAGTSGPEQRPWRQVRDELPVICNGECATFNPRTMMVTLPSGEEVEPSEFQRLSGKNSSKKWKACIRVMKVDGRPGVMIGEWLIKHGWVTEDEGKGEVEVKSEAGGSEAGQGTAAQQHARAASAASMRAGSAGARASRGRGARGRLTHREDCICIICKQARGKGGLQGYGSGPAPQNLWRAGPQVLGGLSSRRAGNPSMRSGKRAYVAALPHSLRGPSWHSLGTIPESKAWEPAVFEKEVVQSGRLMDAVSEQARAAMRRDAAGSGDENASNGNSLALASKSGLSRQTGRDAIPEHVRAANRRDVPGSGDENGNSGNGQLPAKPGQLSRTAAMRQALRLAAAKRAATVTFGKSGIHGWGMFARCRISQDTIVTEFLGASTRPVLSDRLETRYHDQSIDCYLFHAGPTVLLDSTFKGSYTRFTNHSCMPSMYTKVVEVDGVPRLAFLARTDIRPGQELTYDYRFKEEGDEAKVRCVCGAPTCKGFLN